jgi:short-subunit dehydrogenase
MALENVLVTGASRGLGAAIARQLAASGRQVFLAARSADELRTRADEIARATGRTPAWCAIDLRQGPACDALIDAAVSGLGRVDGLINNAGSGRYAAFVEHDGQELADVVALNLVAPMRLARALLPQWIERGEGYLINIGSDLSRRPLANMAPYVASKFGLLGWASSLHREVRSRGVRVTTVLPGIIDSAFNDGTEGTRDARWAMPTADLARIVVQLLDTPPHLVVDELTVHPVDGDY